MGSGRSRRPTVGISAKSPLMTDTDADLVGIYSDKESAAPAFKKGVDYHPLTAWFDHGTGNGGGECATIILRPRNAGSNTVANHVEIIRRALEAAGIGPRPVRKVLVRIDGTGGTKETIESHPPQSLLQRGVHAAGPHAADLRHHSVTAWSPAYNADGRPRDGADVAESCPTKVPSCTSRTWAATD